MSRSHGPANRRALHPTGALFLALTAGLLPSQPEAAGAPSRFRFAFGSDPASPGEVPVSPELAYSRERGYGFEPGALPTRAARFTTSERPFFFSVALPEGSYRVTVTVGDPAGESTTTVKAELRRLMLEQVHTERGKAMKRSFIVNVRTPRLSTGGAVRLKERERATEAWNWDDKLTLELNGARPCLQALEIEPADVPTVYLLGDSTVCDQPLEPWNSWGQMLPRFFKPEVAVANHAESGESLRSALRAGRLAKVLDGMKRGDYLLIQFGHNDMKERGEGVGAFTTYAADLRRFVTETRQRGGIPVLITPMHRKSLGADGKVANTLGDYPEAVRQVARDEKVPLIDLHSLSATLYEALGPEQIGRAFQDGTHHNAYGSYELARCVVEGLRQTGLPLARSINNDLPTFDPAHPDAPEKFRVPPSPQSTGVAPLGN